MLDETQFLKVVLVLRPTEIPIYRIVTEKLAACMTFQLVTIKSPEKLVGMDTD